jgi:phosphate uptake regulator
MEAAIFKVSQLPIRRIDFDNPQDVKMHDALVALVERMLDLHKRLKEAVGEEKKDLERQIARTDRQIDDLVYELYGITEEEGRIIEGSSVR